MIRAQDMNGAWAISNYNKYPSCAKLCDYIVLTEFDIDTGSTVRHQYPEQIDGVAEDWLAENMLPEGAHNRDEDSTYIFLNREKRRLDEELLINPRLTSEGASSGSADTATLIPLVFRYGLNLVQTKHDATVRRGAIVKAMAIFSSYPLVDSLREPLHNALEEYFVQPEVTVLERLYKKLNSHDLSGIPRPSMLEKNLMRWGTASNPHGVSSVNHVPSAWNHKIDFQAPTSEKSNCANKNSVTIPLSRNLDCFGDISLSSLVRTFGEASMRIYSAILSRQRIIFVGYNHAAKDVCCMVLSAVAAISPLPNVLRRTYPYANLTDLSFLETVGYIAGVTNPVFLERDQWWDLACVMDLPNGTGAVYTPEEKKRAEENSKGGSLASNTSSSTAVSSRSNHLLGGLANVGGRLLPFESPEVIHQSAQDTADARFITGLLSVITTRAMWNSTEEEEWVARRFFDYTNSVINIAQDVLGSVSILGSPQLRDVDSSSERIRRGTMEGGLATPRTTALRSSPEFSLIPDSPWVWTASINTVGSDPDKLKSSPDQASGLMVAMGPLLKARVMALQRANNPSPNASYDFLSLLQDILLILDSESSVQAMVSLFPFSLGGLDPIGMGLLHPNPSVRLHAVRILQKVKEHDSTRITVNRMNGALQSAFSRQVNMCGEKTMGLLITEFEQRVALLTASSSTTSKNSPHAVSTSSASSSSSNSRMFGLGRASVVTTSAVVPDFGVGPFIEEDLTSSKMSNSSHTSEQSTPSFLSFAAAASGLMTGIMSPGGPDPGPKSNTALPAADRVRGLEPRQSSIDLIPY